MSEIEDQMRAMGEIEDREMASETLRLADGATGQEIRLAYAVLSAQGDATRLFAEVERLTEFWGNACGRANRASARAEAAETERDAARTALVRVRSIGATSGTNLNAWNEAFDVIDAALSEPSEGES